LKIEFSDAIKNEQQIQKFHMKDVSVQGTNFVTIPGLLLIKDFVTIEEEKMLIDEVSLLLFFFWNQMW